MSGALRSTLAWGILAGLLIGKPLGITVATWAARAAKIGRLPDGMRFGHVVGGGVLAGIGFTVALFITDLSLGPGLIGDEAKLAILAASALAGLSGALTLLVVSKRDRTATV